MGILDGFIDAAQDKFSSAVSRFTSQPENTTSAIGGSIFEALYQYGKGNVDLARERIGSAILESRQGQAIVQEVEQQRLQQWLPWIIGAVLIIFGAGFLFRR